MKKENKDDGLALVKKWAVTGLLKYVKPEDLTYIAVRLETAAKLSIDFNDKDILESEIKKLRKKGLFGEK
jgi:hypothetical protein